LRSLFLLAGTGQRVGQSAAEQGNNDNPARDGKRAERHLGTGRRGGGLFRVLRLLVLGLLVLRLLILRLLVLRLLILRLVVLRILLIAARAVILWRLPSGLRFLLRPRQAFGLLVRDIRRLDSRRGRAEVLRAVAQILGTAHLGRFVLVAATVWGSGSCH
jgi:hypothetical protein